MATSGTRVGFVVMVLVSVLDFTVSNTCTYTYYRNIPGQYDVTTQGYMYCSAGCCGTSPDYYCCTSTYYNYYYYYDNYEITAGAITGIVLGCLVSVAIIIGIIVCSVVMCRNSRLKRQRTHTGGVVYQPSQGVTLVPGAPGQMNPYGVVYQPAPLVQQTAQPNLVQATQPNMVPTGHVLQYVPQPQTIQQGQTAQVQTATENQPSAAATLPVQTSGVTAPSQAVEKSNGPPPPMYTA